jgi:hypothetical protein
MDMYFINFINFINDYEQQKGEPKSMGCRV